MKNKQNEGKSSTEHRPPNCIDQVSRDGVIAWTASGSQSPTHRTGLSDESALDAKSKMAATRHGPIRTRDHKIHQSQERCGLIVVAATNHLFARRPEDQRMLVLRRVRAANIAQGRIRVHNIAVNQRFQTHQVALLAESVQPTAAKGQCPKVRIDRFQQGMRARKPACTPHRSEINHGILCIENYRTAAGGASKFFM